MVVRNTKAQRKPSGEEDAVNPTQSYFIDLELAAASDRSLSLIFAARRCYECVQTDEQNRPEPAEAKLFIERIAEHCSQTPDYLLPDTPLKEAIFRVLLAACGGPKTPQDITQVLSEKWALTAYPRDVSEAVTQRLLDNSESYCIGRVLKSESENVATKS